MLISQQLLKLTTTQQLYIFTVNFPQKITIDYIFNFDLSIQQKPV